MRIIVPMPVLCAILSLATVAACSPAADLADEPAEQQQEFSDEDRRIARALSIGDSRAVANAESPYLQAVLCRHGMGVLAERLGEAGGVTEQQRQSLAQGQAYFEEQLQILAQGEGKTEAEIRADLQQTDADNVDQAQTVRIAIGCLRRLQEAG